MKRLSALKWSFFVVLGIAYFLFPNNASAEDNYFFRIDSELDVPIAVGTGATVTWRCNGSGNGIVTDNTASESAGNQALDGVVKVASTSAENNASHAGCDASESITATVSFDGWITRVLSGTVSAAGSNVTFTTRASMDYNFVVDGVKDELSNTLTLNGTTASVSYSGTTASNSYSGGKRYYAATAGGTLTGGADSYVNKEITGITVSNTASKNADFGLSQTSTYNGDGLPFAVKVTLNGTTRFGEAINNITGATVKAGDNKNTSCTDNSDGKYYCAVPLAHTGVIAEATNVSPQMTENTTCTYTDRTAGGNAQSTCTVSAKQAQNTGGAGEYAFTPEDQKSPTPTPSPAVSGSPVPSPSTTPAPSSTPASSLPPAAVTLFRKASDPKVYVQGSDGTLRWVKTEAEFLAAGYNWADVKDISGKEFARLRIHGKLRVARGIGYLRVRQEPSLRGQVVSKVFSDQSFEFIETSDSGWYKIKKENKDFGWIFGGYVKEI